MSVRDDADRVFQAPSLAPEHGEDLGDLSGAGMGWYDLMCRYGRRLYEEYATNYGMLWDHRSEQEVLGDLAVATAELGSPWAAAKALFSADETKTSKEG